MSSERKLLFSITKKDFKIDWFSGKGAGGQSRNKNQNCCRLTHLETKIMKTGQSSKSRVANQKEAFKALVDSKEFKLWLKMKTSSSMKNSDGTEKEIEERVDEWMDDKYLKIEMS